MRRFLTLFALLGCRHPPLPAAPRPVVAAAVAAPTMARSEAGLDEEASSRSVHYDGWLHVRATRVDVAVDQVVRIAEAHRGRIVRRGPDIAVIVVPVAEFDAAWGEVRGIGERVDEQVSASDRTEAFVAADLRLRTLSATRDRLVALLGRAQDDDEKVALLAEITRVTEQLDRLTKRLGVLRGMAAESRITVQVSPRAAFVASADYPVHGFGWIGLLSAFRVNALPFDRRVELPVPQGMVAVSSHGPFVVEGPEGACLWTDLVDHAPRGDADFWASAIEDRLKPEFLRTERAAVGRWSCVRFVDGSDQHYTWDVCVAGAPDDKKLKLAQVYYPSEAARQRYQPLVETSLRGGAS